MVNFRRNYIKGGSYFFTVTLRDRKSSLLTDNLALLRNSFREMMHKHPVTINAIVVLPEHIHAIFTLPRDDNNYPLRWQMVKSQFTRLLKRQGHVLAKDERGEHRLWQRRYWEHTLKDENDYARHVDYIHYNPVKHGLVNQVYEWPYSSFHWYVRQGLLGMDWGGKYTADKDGFGE